MMPSDAAGQRLQLLVYSLQFTLNSAPPGHGAGGGVRGGAGGLQLHLPRQHPRQGQGRAAHLLDHQESQWSVESR